MTSRADPPCKEFPQTTFQGIPVAYSNSNDKSKWIKSQRTHGNAVSRARTRRKNKETDPQMLPILGGSIRYRVYKRNTMFRETKHILNISLVQSPELLPTAKAGNTRPAYGLHSQLIRTRVLSHTHSACHQRNATLLTKPSQICPEGAGVFFLTPPWMHCSREQHVTLQKGQFSSMDSNLLWIYSLSFLFFKSLWLN